MKNFFGLFAALFLLLSVTSCEAIDTIFQAGKIWGIIVAVFVIGLAVMLFRMFKK